MNRILIIILIPALMPVLISQTSGTAEASGFCEGQGIAGQGGNAGSAGSCGGSHSRSDRSSGESRSRRFPGRPGRDPLDKAKGSGGKSARSRRRGKPCESGRGQKKRKAGELRDGDAAKTGKKRKRAQSPESEKETVPEKNSGDDLIVITERPDDVPFLTGVMMRMGLHEIIDRHIAPHPLQRPLSRGLTAVIWLAYILSEGDHRKVAMRDYIKGMRHTLSHLTEHEINEEDFTDDRLTILLRHLSGREIWEKIENDLSARTVSVYEMPTEVVRCDPTTVSGHHEVTESGLFQFGKSKDNPDLPQIKMITAAADPAGMPLATDIVPGQKADDGLYGSVIKRVSSCLGKKGLLFVGDCKMCAAAVRRYIISEDIGGHYLCPLPRTGKAAEAIERWIERGIERDKEGSLEKVTETDEKGRETVTAKGYVIMRKQKKVFGENERNEEKGKEEEKEKEEEEEEDAGEEDEKWERVFIVKSPAHARQMEKGLEKRLKNAEEKIRALTPPRGRGKRQITEEEKLKEKAEGILKKHRVTGFLMYEYEKEVERKTKYVGRGKGSPDRKKETVERIRYQITAVIRDEEKIEKEKERCGWRAYVTDLTKEKLSLGKAVRHYRNEYRIERVFRRLKSRLHISPMYVKKKDQIRGITLLLTLGVRVLTLTEFIVRRSLKNDNAKLGGLHPENRRKETDTPTAERLLKAFSDITLTIVKKGETVIRHLTPLSDVQKEILKRAGLNPSLYEDLEINKSPMRISEW